MTHAGVAFKRHVDSLVNALDDGLAAVDELVDPEGGVVTTGLPAQPGLVARARADPPVPGRPPARAGGAAAHRRGGERAGVAAARHPSRRRRAHRPAGRGAGIEWRRILVEPLVLAVATNHPLAGRWDVTLSEVAGEPFVMRRGPSGTRTQTVELSQRPASSRRSASRPTTADGVGWSPRASAWRRRRPGPVCFYDLRPHLQGVVDPPRTRTARWVSRGWPGGRCCLGRVVPPVVLTGDARRPG